MIDQVSHATRSGRRQPWEAEIAAFAYANFGGLWQTASSSNHKLAGAATGFGRDVIKCSTNVLAIQLSI